MNMRILVLALLSLSTIPAVACEACGCGVTFGTPGPMVLQQQHFLGWMTTYQRFSYTESNTFDSFIQSELWGRWAFHPRWAVTVRLPYHLHRRITDGDNLKTLTGLGDPRIQLRYLLWSVTDTSRNPQYLFLQAESRLPMSSLTRPEGSELPFRFFPGQSQWMQSLSAIWLYRFGPNWTLNTEAGYSKSLTNDLFYRLGDQKFVSALISRQWESMTRRVSVWGGCSVIHQQRDVENGFFRNNTGGAGASAVLGGQVTGETWSIGLQGQLPVYQNFGEEALSSLPSAQVMLQYRL